MRDPRTTQATELMLQFAERTGLTGPRRPKRYLWTDAFAVCNFLGLAHELGKPRYGELAAELVAQVHHVLGWHRPDDARTGWISGLEDDVGELHPTSGGLRIGKPRPERAPGEPFVERLEWDRDGQYFHYLTKWMVALERFAHATFRTQPLTWARELADTAYRTFTVGPPSTRAMVWKLSIDRTRPLVASMGQHDPLDGLVTCLELDAASRDLGAPPVPLLDDAIAAYRSLIDLRALPTADPLGLGGLLLDAHRLASLPSPPHDLVAALLDAAAIGLDHFAGRQLGQPAWGRLAFRELGLAIGLAAAERLDRDERIARHFDLRRTIETFWSKPEHRSVPSWIEHADINDVMLATCLAPDGLLSARDREHRRSFEASRA